MLALFPRCFPTLVTKMAPEAQADIPETAIEREGLFLRSSGQSSRVKSHWPDMDHTLIHEPIIVAGEMELSR